jgi:hypothetical protein
MLAGAVALAGACPRDNPRQSQPRWKVEQSGKKRAPVKPVGDAETEPKPGHESHPHPHPHPHEASDHHHHAHPHPHLDGLDGHHHPY